MIVIATIATAVPAAVLLRLLYNKKQVIRRIVLVQFVGFSAVDFLFTETLETLMGEQRDTGDDNTYVMYS